MPALTQSQLDAYYLELFYETGECLVWQGAKSRGYGQVWRNGGMRLVHRLVWEDANGPVPEGLEVMHRCDNKACYRLDHLELGTHAQNMQDMAERGDANLPHGEAHHSAKLTEMDVVSIRERYSQGGISQAKLGAEYGVNPRTISGIIRRAAWQHVN